MAIHPKVIHHGDEDIDCVLYIRLTTASGKLRRLAIYCSPFETVRHGHCNFSLLRSGGSAQISFLQSRRQPSVCSCEYPCFAVLLTWKLRCRAYFAWHVMENSVVCYAEGWVARRMEKTLYRARIAPRPCVKNALRPL